MQSYTYKQIMGYRSVIVAALRANKNGSAVKVDLTTAREVTKILREYARVQRNHEDPEND